MTRVLVLYHSSYGHLETLAGEIAAGVREAGAEAAIRRAPETMPEAARRAAHMKVDQAAPEAQVAELADYDAIIVGTPTRFGNASSQMRAFWDQTGGLWAKGALNGKVGGVFVSTGTTGGGQETTAMSMITTLLHHGMLVAGPSYAAPELSDTSELRGGSPYAAGTIAGADGARQPMAKERSLARFHGKRIAEFARKLSAK